MEQYCRSDAVQIAAINDRSEDVRQITYTLAQSPDSPARGEQRLSVRVSCFCSRAE